MEVLCLGFLILGGGVLVVFEYLVHKLQTEELSRVLWKGKSSREEQPEFMINF